MILAAANRNFILAFDLALIAMLFDFLDGTAARALKVTSDLGKDLDSLSDMVSFGVSPAITLYFYWQISFSEGIASYLPLLAFLLPLFAAYRLAIFNNTSQSSEYFKGLATPALALMSYSIPLAGLFNETIYAVMNSAPFIVIYTLLGCYLMLSPIKFLSFKLGSKHKSLNQLRMVLILMAVALLSFFKFFGVILCLIMYLVISLTIQKRLNTV